MLTRRNACEPVLRTAMSSSAGKIVAGLAASSTKPEDALVSLIIISASLSLDVNLVVVYVTKLEIP